MKKIIFSLIVLFAFIPSISLAHPGNTDSSGCHTCRTNCSNWGLSTGEYHCHNNKGSIQPEYPIHSTYGSGGTGYTSPAPDYAYPSISTPSVVLCPLYSYETVAGGCKCMSGYVVNGSSCISEDEWCQNKYGHGSEYDSLDDKCVCSRGYGYDSNSNRCKLASLACYDKLGLMSEYNSITDECECSSGYIFDGDSCISEDEACQDQYGLNSYGKDNNCYCLPGYQFNKEKTSCISIPKATVTNQDIYPVTKNNQATTTKKESPEVKKEEIKVKKEAQETTPSVTEEIKTETNSDSDSNLVPPKKIKWYKKIFNWLF